MELSESLKSKINEAIFECSLALLMSKSEFITKEEDKKFNKVRNKFDNENVIECAARDARSVIIEIVSEGASSATLKIAAFTDPMYVKRIAEEVNKGKNEMDAISIAAEAIASIALSAIDFRKSKSNFYTTTKYKNVTSEEFLNIVLEDTMQLISKEISNFLSKWWSFKKKC